MLPKTNVKIKYEKNASVKGASTPTRKRKKKMKCLLRGIYDIKIKTFLNITPKISDV